MEISNKTGLILNIISIGFLFILLVLSSVYLHYANWDVAMYTDLGIKILEGQRPYVDFFEINFPTIHYLNAIVALVANVTGLNRLFVVHFLVWLATVWASVSIYRLLSDDMPKTIQGLKYIIPLAIAMVSLYVWIQGNYAQRELIFIVFIAPWLVLRFLRWQEYTQDNRWLYLVYGLIAAIGTSIKPHFALIIIMVEAYELLRHRKLKPLFTLEIAGFFAFTLAFILYFVFNPDILANLLDELELVSRGYSAYGQRSILYFVENPSIQFFVLLCMIPFTIDDHDDTVIQFSRISALVTFGGIIILIVQAKGFSYHWIPIWFGGMVMTMNLLAKLALAPREAHSVMSLGRRLFLLPMIWLIFYTGFQFKDNPLKSDNIPFVVPHIEQYTEQEDEVFVLSTSLLLANPWVAYLDRYNVSSYSSAYPLRMADYDPNTSPPEDIIDMLNVIEADLANRIPLVILDIPVFRLLNDQSTIIDELITPYYAIVGYHPRDGIAYYHLADIPESETEFLFGENITLSRWESSLQDTENRIESCEKISLNTIWHTDERIFTRYSFSATIIDENGNSIVQVDQQPSPVSTVDWIPETFHRDDREIQIPCDTPQGNYSLLLTIYDPLVENSNLPIVSSEGAYYESYLWFGNVIVENNEIP